MSLLDRVSTLLRANLNELVEKAEDPERLLKQIVLDMENQLLQLKTQVAIAISDERLLQKKRDEQASQATEWRRKAELAVQKCNDDLARAAIERALSHDQLMTGFAEQAEEQKTESESLRQALRKLDQKLSETRANCEMLVAEHRRARVVGRAAKARQAAGPDQYSTLDRMQSRVHQKAAESSAISEVMNSVSLEDRFKSLENEDKIESLLQEMKSRHVPQLESKTSTS